MKKSHCDIFLYSGNSKVLQELIPHHVVYIHNLKSCQNLKKRGNK